MYKMGTLGLVCEVCVVGYCLIVNQCMFPFDRCVCVGSPTLSHLFCYVSVRVFVFLAHRLFNDLLPLLSKQWENVRFLVLSRRENTHNE